MDSPLGRQRQLASVWEHRRLIDLALAGKPEEAGALISTHILDWKPVLASALKAEAEAASKQGRRPHTC